MYLVDTNILIYHFNNDIPGASREKIADIFINHFNVSIITKLQFLSFELHTEESFNKAKTFLEYATVLPLTDIIADRAISLKRETAMPLADAITVSTAETHNLTLVTKSRKNLVEAGVTIYDPFAI